MHHITYEYVMSHVRMSLVAHDKKEAFGTCQCVFFTLAFGTCQCVFFRRLAHANVSTPHCITLHRTASQCNTLQQTATHCNTLQHTATHCNTHDHESDDVGHAAGGSVLRVEVCCHLCVAVRCSALQCVAVCCSVLQRVAACYNERAEVCCHICCLYELVKSRT